jgi:hypothetical protein
MSKKKDRSGRGSIDDITPEEWNEMARKHREEKFGKKEDTIKVDGITVDTVPLDFTTSIGNPYTLDYGDATTVTLTVTDDDYGSVEHRPDYKFREDELIKEFKEYIDSTYSAHYCQSGIQSSEVIIDRGRGMGFFLGNVDKYNSRYGNKGDVSDHRKDLMKVLHYALLALYVHDLENG